MKKTIKSAAIALEYDGETVPFVSAAGKGGTAAEILRVAQAQAVPIYENPHILSHLEKLKLGEEIPETLYLAIAQIIAFVYFIEGRYPKYRESAESDKQQQ